MPPLPRGLVYTRAPGRHLLWRRLALVLRKGGDPSLARAVAARGLVIPAGLLPCEPLLLSGSKCRCKPH